jgi:hypothetical protein
MAWRPGFAATFAVDQRPAASGKQSGRAKSGGNVEQRGNAGDQRLIFVLLEFWACPFLINAVALTR